MSEAELHLLRARLRGGILNKARRGELRLPLPVGLVYDDQGRVVPDSNVQVRRALRNLFETFRMTGSALATVKRFKREGWLFPRRARGGVNKGELLWGPLRHTQTLNILHNPRYAGAYVFGQRCVRRTEKGKTAHELLAQDQWPILLLEAFTGYIT
jgi:DNA invertase Pin-like site-specific DNA recombinase